MVAKLLVESSVLVFKMGPAAKSTVDVQRVARTDLEAAIVLKVNVEVVNAHALLLTENVTQTFVGTVGSAVEMVLLGFLAKEVIIMNVEI